MLSHAFSGEVISNLWVFYTSDFVDLNHANKYIPTYLVQQFDQMLTDPDLMFFPPTFFIVISHIFLRLNAKPPERFELLHGYRLAPQHLQNQGQNQ